MPSPRDRLNDIGQVLLATGLFLLVALLNGFPTVHYDTGTYTNSAFSLEVPVDRPVFYSLFIWFSQLPWNSFWSTVLLQSFLSAVVIFLLVRCAFPVKSQSRRIFLWAALILTLFSSLPWFTGFIMSDLFTGWLLIASTSLLLFWDRLHVVGRAFMMLIAAYALMVHTSHVVIFPIFLISCAWLIRKSFKERKRAFLACWGVFLAALMIIPLANGLLDGHFKYSRGSHVFLLARLIHHGAVYKLLTERCDVKNYALCDDRAYVNGIDGDVFLWNADSPLKKIGGWENSKAAIWPMIIDSLIYAPGLVVAGTMKAVARQIVDFRTGASMHAYNAEKAVHRAIRSHYPAEFGVWQNSLQQRSRLTEVVKTFNYFQIPLGYAVLLILLASAFCSGPTTLRLASQAVISFFLINAIVCGTFSDVDSRYESRVMWPGFLVAILVIAGHLFTFLAQDPEGA